MLVFSLCLLYPLCFANEGRRKNPAKLMFCKTKKSSLQPFLINLQRNSFLPFSDKLSLNKNKLLKETILNYFTNKSSQVSQAVWSVVLHISVSAGWYLFQVSFFQLPVSAPKTKEKFIDRVPYFSYFAITHFSLKLHFIWESVTFRWDGTWPQKCFPN